MPEAANRAAFGTAMFPAIDVVDTDTALEVSAEVPDVKEEDLGVSFSGDVQTLKGEKSADHEEKEENYHLIERQYGSFRRRIPLGFTPEEGAMDSSFGDDTIQFSDNALTRQ